MYLRFRRAVWQRRGARNARAGNAMRLRLARWQRRADSALHTERSLFYLWSNFSFQGET